MTTFADRLQAMRKAAGLTLYQLAEKTGLSKTYLWELESGAASNPSGDVLLALSRELGQTVDWLLRGAEPSPPHATVKVAIRPRQIIEALRDTINDNRDFHHRHWSLLDAETLENAARLIREGYKEKNNG